MEIHGKLRSVAVDPCRSRSGVDDPASSPLTLLHEMLELFVKVMLAGEAKTSITTVELNEGDCLGDLLFALLSSERAKEKKCKTVKVGLPCSPSACYFPSMTQSGVSDLDCPSRGNPGPKQEVDFARKPGYRFRM
jgi:hypothetical protein